MYTASMSNSSHPTTEHKENKRTLNSYAKPGWEMRGFFPAPGGAMLVDPVCPVMQESVRDANIAGLRIP